MRYLREISWFMSGYSYGSLFYGIQVIVVLILLNYSYAAISVRSNACSDKVNGSGMDATFFVWINMLKIFPGIIL